VIRFLVTWRHRDLRRSWPVGVLTAEHGGYLFSYLPTSATTPGFVPFPNFPALGRVYESRELFPFFSQRVMDPRRSDYEPYLRALALPPDASAVDVLGRANGQRKGDSVLVVREPTIGLSGSLDHSFLVSGVRHVPVFPGAALERLRDGAELRLRAEPANPTNPAAMHVLGPDNVVLGWVPDALAATAQEASRSDYVLSVLRVNDETWPGHLRLVVRLRGHVSADFDPFGLARIGMLGPMRTSAAANL
jgi:hypothetical protein